MKRAVTDPIADLLTRLRNACLVAAASTVVPHSRMKEQLVKLLADYGYVGGFKVDRTGRFAVIEVELAGAKRPITNLKSISTPGRRVYRRAGDIRIVRGGLGLAIVSTSQGLMAGHTAKARQLGGELICEVY
ncbi:30S ribosomal protein S8 [Candidatus Microgenomates bacterium]|nr:30S ribosomal protein S8 [Candidatus Microgenomates bacterium]